jgi:V8-like Glu-specific endopeptidase/KaiC/GvpD/RAD55 family RecA-like ATPase
MNNQENAARSGIALILNDQKVAVGTGFLVSEQLILTCAHVIETAAGSSGSIVTLSFLLDQEKVLLKAQVEEEYWRDSNKEDVAVLKLLEVLPKKVSQSGVAPFQLGTSNNTKNHSFQTFGFPKGHGKDGLGGYGKVGDALDKDGQSLIQITSEEVTLGFSGAPIWDDKTQRVIGMVTSRTEPDGAGRLEKTAFFTPSEVLQKICSELKIPNFCPYLGLSAFTEKDAHLFFGRQSLIDQLVELLRKNPKFLAVVGTSGSGKSSLVRAGLFPQIKEITGFEQVKSIYQLRPSNAKTPEKALIGAFPDLQKVDVGTENVWEKIESYLKQEKCSRIVLFIDQFEELFAEFKEEEHISFAKGLNNLLENNSNLTLIITMRSEFYTQLYISELGHFLPLSQVNVDGILDEQGLKDVITKPAEQVGLDLEDRLIDVMIGDLKDTKNPLPLLEFTLEQLWKSENGNNRLTYDSYINPKIGGVTGAIAQWANKTYDKLSNQNSSKDQKLTLKREEVQGLIKRIFISLVRVGNENQPDTRKSLSKDDLSEVGHVQLIQDLASARLLVTGNGLKRSVRF